ncbi:MAG: nitroreductase family protein [Candidatus Micrarchaeia archaeon]|jgi:nitroreductase
MGFFELIKNRFSARSYLPKEVEKEKLDKILLAASFAPSAGNLQAYKIVIVSDKRNREELAYACNEQDYVADAPVSLIFLADLKASGKKYGDRGMRIFAVQDATIAASYAQLAVSELGLASVFVGTFETMEVMRIANAGEYEVPIAVIPIGYTSEKPEKKVRKSLEKLVK